MPKRTTSNSTPNLALMILGALLFLGVLSFFINKKEIAQKRETERVQQDQKATMEETSLEKITEDVDSEEFTEIDREMARFAEETDE